MLMILQIAGIVWLAWEALVKVYTTPIKKNAAPKKAAASRKRRIKGPWGTTNTAKQSIA